MAFAPGCRSFHWWTVEKLRSEMMSSQLIEVVIMSSSLCGISWQHALRHYPTMFRPPLMLNTCPVM